MLKLDSKTLRRFKTLTPLCLLSVAVAYMAYWFGEGICFSIDGCPAYFRGLVLGR